jgi:murein DD-endopeptidase MepM/ murein hydrolase activator NlpD
VFAVMIARLGRALAALCLVTLLVASGGAAWAQDGQGTPPATPPPTSPPTANTTTIHVVQRGENLFRIAQRYGTTVEDIAQANGLRDVTQLQIGQRLLIPNIAPNAPDAPPGTVPGSPTEYVVQPGDSLINLSLRYGTPIAAIARQNNIVNPAQLYVGLSLALKEGSNPQAEIKTGWLHVVQPDDNLYRIAARYHLSMARLVKANGLKRTSVVFPGQHLVIPGGDDGPALVDVPEPFAQIAMLPAPAEQGRTFTLHLTTQSPVKLTGTFMQRALVVHSDESRTNHTILFGVNSLANPGIYPLDLVATDDQGKRTELARPVQVADGGYSSETIQLPPDQADLLDPKVTGPEMDKIARVVSNYTAQRYFDGPLGLPCPAPVTSQYGTRRSYDGGPYDQFHTGTDFAGAPGSPIYAPAAGVVVMAERLHVRGNATIIDHGWGVYTGYWHQAEIKVKVGDIVKPGQVIGLVGDTGRATGPHLHWELFVGGVQVDPLQWARQNFS